MAITNPILKIKIYWSLRKKQHTKLPANMKTCLKQNIVHFPIHFFCWLEFELFQESTYLQNWFSDNNTENSALLSETFFFNFQNKSVIYCTLCIYTIRNTFVYQNNMEWITLHYTLFGHQLNRRNFNSQSWMVQGNKTNNGFQGNFSI